MHLHVHGADHGTGPAPCQAHGLLVGRAPGAKTKARARRGAWVLLFLMGRGYIWGGSIGIVAWGRNQRMTMPALKFDGTFEKPCNIVLAHGANAPMTSPFMAAMAEGLAERGFRVCRFEFPYMAARRKAGTRRPPNRPEVLMGAFRDVLRGLGGAGSLVVGGKSMGGRIASMLVDEVGARGLVCLGYPFHPPGKPDAVRIAHLASLKAPALMVQGTRDAFGSAQDVAGYDLSSALRFHWIEDGDHSFKPSKASGRSPQETLEEAVSAMAAFIDQVTPARRAAN